ncbi:MAG: hypothetical protein SGJ27_07285 [Candidatus Melainabacteria bacterium]|nr:hypothetical protein [Candidatus Melainabacteria bacterium]
MNMKNALLWGVVTVCLFGSPAMAQDAPPPRLTPATVKRGWFEDRRIMIEVMTDSAFTPHKDGLRPGAPATFPFGEHFGVRIGNVIPMRINVYVLKPTAGQRPIQVDFNPLKQGRLTIDPNTDPDFKLASQAVLPKGESPVSLAAEPVPVTLNIGDNQYEAELYEIRVYVQTFRQPQPMRFAVEFAYAAETVKGTSNPDWKRILTPEYILSMSRTADDSPDISAGNTTFVAQTPPAGAATFLVIIGSLCLVTPAAFLLIGYLRRTLKIERLIDPEERAWSKLEPLLDRTRKGTGYELCERDVAKVVGIVLTYIGKPALASHQLDMLKYEDDDGDLLIEILGPLMAILEGKLPKGETLSTERFGVLIGRIEQLIPKP